MTDGDELVERVLARFPVDELRRRHIFELCSQGPEPHSDKTIGWKLMGLAPELDRNVPGKRFQGLFNNPNWMSSTANWKRTLWECRLDVEGNPDPDPYWVAWLEHCETTLAFRAMIPEQYRQWRPDKPDESCPRDDETPQEYDARWRREAKELHEARERAKLIGAIE